MLITQEIRGRSTTILCHNSHLLIILQEKKLILLKEGNIYPKLQKLEQKNVMSFPYRSNYLSNSSSQHIQRQKTKTCPSAQHEGMGRGGGRDPLILNRGIR